MRLGEPLIRTQRKFLLPPENSLNSGHREIAGRRQVKASQTVQPGKCGGKYLRFPAAKQFRLLAMDIRAAMMSPERSGLAFWLHLQEQPFYAEYKAFLLSGSEREISLQS